MNFRFLNPLELSSGQLELEEKFDISFLGTAVDSRGAVSRRMATINSRQQHHIEYDHDTLSVKLGNESCDLMNFLSKKNFFKATKVLIDATNLSFAEMVILIRIFLTSNNKMRVSFLYVEPERYATKVWSPSQLRPFELSKKLCDVDFIPSFYRRARPNQVSSLLAFMGFEEVRFSRAVDVDSGNEFSRISVVFSVPPFQAGWDTHSLMVSSRVLREHPLHEACFTAGNQPYEAFKLIERHKLLASRERGVLTLVPFGTKPTTIAISLAAACDEELSVLFDFPERTNNRSSGVGIAHLYPVDLLA